MSEASSTIKPLKTTNLPDGSPLHIVKERDNKLIRRLEIEGVVVHIGKGTPSRNDIVKAIAKLYNKPEELIIVKKILSEYGMGMSRIKVHIYEDINRLKSFEPEYIIKRHGRS